ncbi:hypothetical protein FRB90_008543 [Tulasnella sp. 427]|nr:hypothetical protein FRB90_008543 [Tulasnella sp. 427]
MDLVISRRSNDQTPAIGTGASAYVLPATLPDLGKELDLRPIVPPDCSPIQSSLRTSLAAETRSFLKNVLSSLQPSSSPASTTKAITDFLCAEESTPVVVDIRMSPPLFLRVAPSLARQKQRLRGNDLSDLESLVGEKVDTEPDEMYYIQKSFKSMDGMKAPELSSPTANSNGSSPTSSQSGKLDKRWNMPSDTPEVGLDQWKMGELDYTRLQVVSAGRQHPVKVEEVQFPRSRQVAQPTFNRASTAHGLIWEVRLKEALEHPIPSNTQLPSRPDYSTAGNTSLSMMAAVTAVGGNRMDLDEKDDLLIQVYKDVQAQDPFPVILNEKFDQKNSWIMELPDQPKPGGRRSSLSPPPHLPVTVAPPIKKGERPSLYTEFADEGLAFNLRLRKVGRLRIPNLSWSPSIQDGGTIPTSQGVACVEGDLDLERESVDFLEGTHILCLSPPKPSTERLQISCTSTTSTTNHSEHGTEVILLTRAELRRLGSIHQIPEGPAALKEHHAESEMDDADHIDVEMIIEDTGNPSLHNSRR